IEPFFKCGVPCVLFIEGADRFKIGKKLEIAAFERHIEAPGLEMRLPNGDSIPIEAADLYTVMTKAEVLARIEEHPCAWRIQNVIFLAVRSKVKDPVLPAWIWKTMF
ncbi:MAG: hypothetical protein ABIH23_11100, partial [bacterium]